MPEMGVSGQFDRGPMIRVRKTESGRSFTLVNSGQRGRGVTRSDGNVGGIPQQAGAGSGAVRLGPPWDCSFFRRPFGLFRGEWSRWGEIG